MLEHGASLTLVVAPAGYGKTTLVADWLEQCASAFRLGDLRRRGG
jgi:ATP/maltotriose-dependent transcriptional regulator MalT